MFGLHFNSHAHVERDHATACENSHPWHFNSHAHVERDAPAITGVNAVPNFNSHAHVERDGKDAKMSWQTGHFNSHAHVERDLFAPRRTDRRGISTHTLTWSVTDEIVGNFTKGRISTHTLTWSVTMWVWHRMPRIINFNSHAHVERDSLDLWANAGTHHFNSHAHVERDLRATTQKRGKAISTHTLTWSVTSVGKHISTEFTFQLTRSRGAWRRVKRNSHKPWKISTHTLTWSVTCLHAGTSDRYTIFQLTRSRGAWRDSVVTQRVDVEFQLTRSRGAWPGAVLIRISWASFQLTRSRGAWRWMNFMQAV